MGFSVQLAANAHLLAYIHIQNPPIVHAFLAFAFADADTVHSPTDCHIYTRIWGRLR